MNTILPPDLQEEIVTEVIASLKRGLSVRRHNIAWSCFFLAVSLVGLIIWSPSNAVFIGVMLAASSLCIIWAVMSMSASINAQLDAITILLKFYAAKYHNSD